MASKFSFDLYKAGIIFLGSKSQGGSFLRRQGGVSNFFDHWRIK